MLYIDCGLRYCQHSPRGRDGSPDPLQPFWWWSVPQGNTHPFTTSQTMGRLLSCALHTSGHTPGPCGTCYPQEPMFPSESHTVSKMPWTKRGREIWSGAQSFFLQWPGQLAVSPGVASSWCTMPLPSDTSLKLPAAGSQAGLPVGPALVPSASESSGGPAGAL